MNIYLQYYDEDKSTLIKHSLKEMYEDIVDKKIVEDYELKETKKKPHFINSERNYERFDVNGLRASPSGRSARRKNSVLDRAKTST